MLYCYIFYHLDGLIMNIKTLLLTGVFATLTLTACQKPQQTENAQTAEPVAAEHHDHEHDDHHHDHEHGHHHGHHDEVAYQCEDKTVYIAVHNHDGEMEAHLRVDDIVYDLDQDPTNSNRYFRDDEGIEGEHKGMALVLDGEQATVTGHQNNVLLQCQKSNS